MLRRFLILWLFPLCAFAQQSGYNGYGSCYQTLGEAVTAAAKFTNGAGYCVAGNCRVLSYVPATFIAQIIDGTNIRQYSIPPCSTTTTFATLPSGVLPSPWYGTDPGTVSQCGGTTSTSGGISSSSGSTSVVASLGGWSMTVEEGIQIAAAIVGLVAVAAVWKALISTASQPEREEV